jgi:intein/homing endonuclease
LDKKKAAQINVLLGSFRLSVSLPKDNASRRQLRRIARQIYNKINKNGMKEEEFLKKVEESIPQIEQLISRKLQRWLAERPKTFKRDFWKEWTCIISIIIISINPFQLSHEV